MRLRLPALALFLTLPVALALLVALAATTAFAKVVDYMLDPAASTVAFETDFGPDQITGTIPLLAADVALDFDEVRNCTVAVALDVTGATASFPFAAQALKGPKVLDTANFPQLTFQSTSVIRDGDGAAVTGNLTIRGVTRPVTLLARISRPAGSAEGDMSRLTVQLTGAVNRSDFGATGWMDMVGDEVRIIITARIDVKG